MTAKTAQTETVSTMMIGQWEQVGRKLAALAENFPEDKYESKPVDGVRTFGEVLRHVAFWNQYVADSARGKKADDSANELPKSEYSTKKRILEALKKTTADVAAALSEHRGELDLKTVEMLATFIAHNSEHYGQLVVYSRVNGVAPPA